MTGYARTRSIVSLIAGVGTWRNQLLPFYLHELLFTWSHDDVPIVQSTATTSYSTVPKRHGS
ncbi:hypothetical protein BGW80DRAFT_1319147 [Lactifluus volemus]|nr:hypothetical protein BGW80DRAFT_1319147 [Lactifluus volemus]